MTRHEVKPIPNDSEAAAIAAALTARRQGPVLPHRSDHASAADDALAWRFSLRTW